MLVVDGSSAKGNPRKAWCKVVWRVETQQGTSKKQTHGSHL